MAKRKMTSEEWREFKNYAEARIRYLREREAQIRDELAARRAAEAQPRRRLFGLL